MSVSVRKTGILTCGGTGVGINLVWNGNALNSSTKWGKWSTATGNSVEFIDGKYWFHHISDGTGTKYGGWYQDNNSSDQSSTGFKPNTNYTLSALWFASANTNVRYWLHMRSTEGGANISQLLTTFTVGVVPARYYYTFNSGTNANYTINRFNLMMGSVNCTSENHVYFTDVKMEEGTIATPYCPNVHDGIYVSDECGVFECSYSCASFGTDYSVGGIFYEY